MNCSLAMIEWQNSKLFLLIWYLWIAFLQWLNDKIHSYVYYIIVNFIIQKYKLSKTNITLKLFYCNYSETKVFCNAPMPGPMHFGVCNPRKQTETKTAMHEWPLLDQVIFDDDSQTATKLQIVVLNVGFALRSVSDGTTLQMDRLDCWTDKLEQTFANR